MTELKSTLPQKESSSDWLSRPLALALRLDWERTIYLAIIIAAILSRFISLGDRVVSHDESLHTQYSYQYYNGDGYQHTPLMHGPFLFHITALTYWLFGHNDFTARTPVAIFGIILVCIPYFLRGWLGRRGALFASFILLISPYITYYSRYIRHDIYVIMWSLIIFIATWHYLRDGEERSLWWFSGGLALMFSTKEVSFIYVAIFGSFLVVRLLGRMAVRPWFGSALRQVAVPLAVVAVGGLLVVGGHFAKSSLEAAASQGETATTEQETFAADPNAAVDQPEAVAATAEGITAMRWLQIAGIVIIGGSLFWAATRLRGRLLEFREFDLIILYASLLLPSITALPVVMAGWNPLDYNTTQCGIAGQESLNSFQLFITRITTPECWAIFVSSGPFRTAIFLIPLLLASISLGVWWKQRTWLICAAIFHTIFLLLYTSFFTNPWGWFSGTVGSLGYWLEQQEVKRGTQPWFYYGIVMPMYEYLPLLFSLLALRLWAIKNKIHRLTSFWIWLLLAAVLTYSLSNWYFNLGALLVEEQSRRPGLIGAAVVLLVGAAYWFLMGQERALKAAGIDRWRKAVDTEALFGFVPGLAWWLLLTVIAYSYAGEKMPWLSTHFVIPMAFLVGWYFNERLREVSWSDIFNSRTLALVGATIVFIVMVFLAFMPIFLGRVSFGDQQAAALNSTGQFLGSLVVAGALLYAIVYKLAERVPSHIRPLSWLLAVFLLLSLLTIRTTYRANFPNADYATEYMVYAHGAPATKREILRQIEQLSMRMYGDKSIKVVYDNESSWPYTWYLRDYPNRQFIGANPTPDVADAPVLLIGNGNWTKVEPFLRNQYEEQTYIYIWWPMEEYRNISWNAIFGDPAVPAEQRRGLLNAGVREALWDIFFYRDYTKYGEVFGRNYQLGQWPLRDDVRLYIRKDAQALLWDYGVGAREVTVPVDPYAEGELPFEPSAIIGVPGSAEGQLLRPRNLAVAEDGRLYVADSGNHRIQIFEADGSFVRAFGEFGTAEGQFNEPWGIAVDDEFIYVADTWNHRVQKFTKDGKFVAAFGQSGTPEDPATGGGLFFGPRDVLLLGDDQLAVTDTGNHRVQIFDRDGNFVQVFGRLGGVAGEFYEPVGLATAPDGTLWVADTWNKRMQSFERVDDFYLPQTEWFIEAWKSQSIENKPYVAVDSSGRVYVTDPEGYQLLIFEQDGTYVGRMGHYSVDLTGFGLSNGIVIDAADNVYVADAENGRILKFAPLLPSPAAAQDTGVAESAEATPADDNSGEGQSEGGGN